jgi:transposase-like protein
MFSYEERVKTVKLLLQYDKNYATVIRELGYPSRRALTNWCEEYIKNGDLHKDYIKESKYSDEDRRKAVDYNLEHGRCVSRTVKALGYPNRRELYKWINEIAPKKAGFSTYDPRELGYYENS